MSENDIYKDSKIQDKLRAMNRKDRRKWFKKHHMPVDQRPWVVMPLPSNNQMNARHAVVSMGDWNQRSDLNE